MQEFNARSTMPSSTHRLGLSRNQQTHERLERSQQDKNINSTHYHESPSTSFFVRVSKQSLQEQRRIYKWRLNCNESFVKISNFKLQTEGNCYNPNFLYKIQLPITKSNFVQVKDLCLTKCVSLLKQTLAATLLLFGYFEPVILTEKMIYLTEEGDIKVWVDERFYINPNNELYQKEIIPVQLSQSLRSIIDIFVQKCLKTKLSTKLFTRLTEVTCFNKAIEVIQNFEFQENLFPIQGLKNSMSTCAAFNTSSSLEFSTNKSLKKRKITNRAKKINDQRLANSHSRKFLKAKSMQINTDCLKQQKQAEGYRLTHKSQHTNYIKVEQSCYLKIKVEKPSSLIVSELFKSDHEINPEKRKDNKNSPQQVDVNNKALNISVSDISAQNQGIKMEVLDADHDIQSILFRNGWSTNLGSLFDRMNVKQSMCQGKQINAHLQGFRLKKLGTMGKDVRQSIMSICSQQNDY